MKFCSNCGAQLQDNARFCGECGQKQDVTPVQATPVYEAPVQQDPVCEAPVYEVPVQQEPVYEAPVYEAPVQEEPAYEAPVYEAPVYEAPAYEAPAYEAPAYEAPAYEAPAYEAPAYETPAYEVPQQQYNPAYGAPVYDPVGYGGAVPQQPKKKKTGLIIGIAVAAVAVISLVLVLVLGGGGGGNQTVHYEAYSCEMYGMELGVDDEWIELHPDGTATIRLVYDDYEGTWKLDGTKLTIKMDGDKYVGTLKNGEIEMEFWGMTYLFSEDESKVSSWNNDDDVVSNDTVGGEWIEPQPEATLPVEDVQPDSPAISNDLSYWEGDWYGWWVISTVYEGDPDIEGNWWDACANLQIDEDGDAYLTVWDEDFTREDPIGEAEMSVWVEDGELWFESYDGWFMSEGLDYCEWSGHTNEMDYPEVMCFIGEYDDGDVRFDYLFFLRPWGTIWDDAEREDPDDLPYYYYDWYLPLIEAGEGRAPSLIGG